MMLNMLLCDRATPCSSPSSLPCNKNTVKPLRMLTVQALQPCPCRHLSDNARGPSLTVLPCLPTRSGAEGALRSFEGLALLQAFRGNPGLARATFQQGAAAHPPTSRFLRGWALFEKRQSCFKARMLHLLQPCRALTASPAASVLHGYDAAFCAEELGGQYIARHDSIATLHAHEITACFEAVVTLVLSTAGSGGPFPVVIARQPVRRPYLDELGAHGAPPRPHHTGTATLQVSHLIHSLCRRLASWLGAFKSPGAQHLVSCRITSHACTAAVSDACFSSPSSS